MAKLIKTGEKAVVYSPTQGRVIDKVIACRQDSNGILRNIVTGKPVKGWEVQEVRTFPNYISKK